MLFVHLKTASFFLQPKRSRYTIRYNWYNNIFAAFVEKYKLLKTNKEREEDNKHRGMTPWKSTFGCRGLLKSQQSKKGVEGNTHTNVCESI